MSDTKQTDDGGAAFPLIPPLGSDGFSASGYPYPENGMTLRDWFAGHAPEPHADYILMHQQLDRNRNPHNDAHKPKLRSSVEIVAAFKFEFADAMIAARKGGAA